ILVYLSRDAAVQRVAMNLADILEAPRHIERLMKPPFTLRATLLFLMAAAAVPATAQAPSSAAAEARGLAFATDAATPGYTLFAPLNSTVTYLIDTQGRVVKTWRSEYVSGAWVYLADNGHLLRGGREPETHGFSGGGQGGRFQEFDFDGTLVWDFSINTAERLPHHDVALLPNGNVLAVVWERMTYEQAHRAGRRQGFIPPDGVW